MAINYQDYLNVCREAVKSEKTFKNFKNHPDYRGVLEHVSYKQGLDYLNEIKMSCPYILEFMEQFARNDKIGSPQMFWYSAVNLNMSPTTLRYVKVLADLIDNFGRLDDMNIIEIGGGYGGQCAVIKEYTTPLTYTIVDYPEAMTLTRKFLEIRGRADDVYYRSIYDDSDVKYDLFLSNYAFTEIERRFQNIYYNEIIKKSDKGYITCNFMGDTSDGRMSKKEILSMMDNGKEVEEKPLTYPDNFIYVWNFNLK